LDTGCPIIVETDASDYAIAGILSLLCPDGQVRLAAFYLHTLSTPDLNYDMHDKELVAIFEAFCSWRHFLEGSTTPVNIVTDHKNLKYFTTTRCSRAVKRAGWIEYLHQFNLIICFCPGKLGAKPDALTRCWDVYPKEGDKDYTRVGPHNFHPVFMQEQLALSL
jgi:hypothetical protein